MQNVSKEKLISWLILGVLGLLLIIGKDLIKGILYAVFAIGLILAAASGILGWWKEKSRKKDDLMNLLGSLVLLGIGIWIFVNPEAFDALINIMIGIVLIVNGVIWVYRGIRLGMDWLVICLGAVSLILGIIIITTLQGTEIAIIVEGISLIYTAITGMIGEKRFAD